MGLTHPVQRGGPGSSHPHYPYPVNSATVWQEEASVNRVNQVVLTDMLLLSAAVCCCPLCLLLSAAVHLNLSHVVRCCLLLSTVVHFVPCCPLCCCPLLSAVVHFVCCCPLLSAVVHCCPLCPLLSTLSAVVRSCLLLSPVVHFVCCCLLLPAVVHLNLSHVVCCCLLLSTVVHCVPCCPLSLLLSAAVSCSLLLSVHQAASHRSPRSSGRSFDQELFRAGAGRRGRLQKTKELFGGGCYLSREIVPSPCSRRHLVEILSVMCSRLISIRQIRSRLP